MHGLLWNGWRAVVWGLALASAGAAGEAQAADATDATDAAQAADAEYPRRPIKVIVPFSPGGSSDTFARTMKAALDEYQLLPEPLVIVNIRGAGGTIGSRRVKRAKPDGYTVLLLHDALLTAKYSGKVPYGPEAFTPALGTGRLGTFIVVREDSPWDTLPELLADARGEQGRAVRVAANLGAPSHFAGLLLENAHAGCSFRFVQTGGGPQRFAALDGGHVEMTSFATDEFVRFRTEGLRALAFLGAERHPAAPEVPTATELGYPVIQQIGHYWWFPRGTPPARVRVFSDALEAAMGRTELRRKLEAMQIDPVVLRGEELAAHLRQTEASLAEVDLRKTLGAPPVAMVVVAMCGALAALAWAEARGWLRWGRRASAGVVAAHREGEPGEAPATPPRQPETAGPRDRWRDVLLTSGFTAALLPLLLWGMPLGAALLLYTLAVGGVLNRGARRGWPLFVAVVSGFAVIAHGVFTYLYPLDFG